jgi:hypothetical protein
MSDARLQDLSASVTATAAAISRDLGHTTKAEKK